MDPNRSAAEIRELESRYRTLLEQIPAIVYVWSISGGLDHIAEDYVSPQIEEVLGYRAEEWIADPRLWIERLYPDDRDEVLDQTTRSAEAGEPFTLEYRMLARNGRVVWLHDVASVLERDERRRATRYQGVQLDITARKEAEHAQRRSFEQLSDLHRIQRRLVARIVAAQENERRRIADAIHDDTLRAMFGVQQRLSTMERDLRHTRRDGGSRLVSKDVAEVIRRLRRLAFDLHPPDLLSGELIDALRGYIERWSSEPGAIRYELEADIAPPPTQIGSLAYRIAQEALTNVRNHSTATRASVNISDNEGGVLVRISDNGIGFEVASVLSSAGEHFGLASMRERAEAVGGWCRIESSPAAGTLVEFWLPLTDVREPAGPASAVESDARATDPTVAREAAAEGWTTGHLVDLTPREIEIAELLARGHTNKEIAAILHVSIRTVEHHRTSVFRKAGVHSRAGLITWMREHHRGGAASDR